MRVARAVAVFFLALLLLPGVTAAQAKKVTTVDELAKMYDVSSCKQCHAKEFKEWEKSIHARSLIGTGRTMATIKTAIQDGMMKEWVKSGIKEVKDIKVEHMLHCLKCHLPQLKDATDAVAQQIAKAVIDSDTATLEKININCIICHNQKALIHKYVDGEAEKNAIYGNKEGSHGDKMFTVLKKSPIMKESILCGQCHGLGPNFELANPTQCATLYGSYLHNYVQSAGVVPETCQDCHMTKHKTGHTMPGYRDPAIAKSAVAVEVTAKGYHVLFKAGEHIPTAAVQVKMTSNAGHRIPDGWPSPNRVVLDVTAKTKDGKEIFSDAKIYMPQSPAYGRGDKMVFGPFRKSGMLRDTALQPGQTRTETFEIKFPYEDSVDKDGKKVRDIKAKAMDVTVKLWYLPAGGDHRDDKAVEVNKGKYLFFETTKNVTVK